MGLLSPKDLWRGGWEPADKSPCTSLPAQVMFCSWDALRGYWKVGDKGGEGSLAAPCSRWPPSSSSTRAAASALDPSSQAHRPPLTSPMVAPPKLLGIPPFLLRLSSPGGGSRFMQFLTCGSVQHSLCTFSALTTFWWPIPLTNPLGLKYLVPGAFLTGPWLIQHSDHPIGE